MDKEKQLEQQIAALADLAKEGKKVDVAALMTNALEQARRNETDAKKKRQAYMVSILVPPLGFLYAARYYFSEKDDGKQIALMCVVLTIGGLAIGWIIGSAMFGNTPTGSLEQMKAVNLEEFRSLIE